MLEFANALVLMLLGAMLFSLGCGTGGVHITAGGASWSVFTFDVSPLLRFHDRSESHCRFVIPRGQ